ncbi:hypothetical protein VC83_05508 [Pseudogymnoascus destructans]|uniref:Transcription factor CBF/NF-Y/archaeal histone domain-containing protein n=2 Tax=Pseudogymnoascus destructans TaxID=655981 RepID=L8GAE3_PSED2|nr:uncharacterized protein VC83_05508 [Pseudogymnoascus destructans]ELR09593.1 hypothetical protein GMDG_04087 [Pseudogymnoascus destructans 20631-21]OAF57778.1 hypothetical protein VC83_05508 [Pseudogymnoascus destructans]
MPPSAIPPRGDTTGTSQLPLSRVKRLIALDPDIAACSNPAAFLIALATESFIQHLSTSAHSVVRSERKPRKNIQYRDLAAAVARMDTLEFLSDVVPRTVTFKEVKAKKAREGKENGEVGLDAGQTTLVAKGFEAVVAKTQNGRGESVQVDGTEDADDEDADADPERQLQMESQDARTSFGSEPRQKKGGTDGDGDVEMS